MPDGGTGSIGPVRVYAGGVQYVVQPAPTDAEAVAIVAAMDALWPSAAPLAPVEQSSSQAWRYSGRWWQRDRLAHADRPWR